MVCHKDLDKVVEYDPAGKEIWSVAVPVPWSAVRLKNGNTLVSSGSTQVVREFDAKGKVVWEFSQPDIQVPTNCQRLPNNSDLCVTTTRACTR